MVFKHGIPSTHEVPLFQNIIVVGFSLPLLSELMEYMVLYFLHDAVLINPGTPPLFFSNTIQLDDGLKLKAIPQQIFTGGNRFLNPTLLDSFSLMYANTSFSTTFSEILIGWSLYLGRISSNFSVAIATSSLVYISPSPSFSSLPQQSRFLC